MLGLGDMLAGLRNGGNQEATISLFSGTSDEQLQIACWTISTSQRELLEKGILSKSPSKAHHHLHTPSIVQSLEHIVNK